MPIFSPSVICDALPADHCAKSESDRDAHLLTHNGMNLVDLSSCFLKSLKALVICREPAFLVLRQNAQRLRVKIHVVAKVPHLVERRLGDGAVLLDRSR